MNDLVLYNAERVCLSGIGFDFALNESTIYRKFRLLQLRSWLEVLLHKADVNMKRCLQMDGGGVRFLYCQMGARVNGIVAEKPGVWFACIHKMEVWVNGIIAEKLSASDSVNFWPFV